MTESINSAIDAQRLRERIIAWKADPENNEKPTTEEVTRAIEILRGGRTAAAETARSKSSGGGKKRGKATLADILNSAV